MMHDKYESDKKVLIYCRESRDDYGEKYERIETQKDILLDFCRRKGLVNIVDIIMDDNVSGTSFKRLDEIKEMMVRGDIDLFVCKDASRLGRNLLESLKFIEFINENNVQLLFESEDFNPELFPLIAWFNERRAKDDSDKIRRVLRHKMENGLVISVPFGYIKQDGVMIPDPDTAPIVMMMFKMAYDGSTASQIADFLNVQNIKSPSEGNKSFVSKINPIWTTDKVRTVLKNKTYVGTLISGKRKKASYKSKKMINLPENEWIVLTNHHEAIIDEDVFNRVQQLFRSGNSPSRKPTNNPFSGLLVCGRCGRSIIVRKRKNGIPVTYVCNKYNLEGCIKDEIRKSWGCNPHCIEYEDLKNIVINYVSKFIENEKFKNEILKNIKLDEGNSRIKQTIKNLKSREYALKRKFHIMYEDRLNGSLPEFLFADKTSEITSELKKLNEQIILNESNLKQTVGEDPIERYQKLISNLYENGIASEGMKLLFKKVIIYEPFEIERDDILQYSISEEQYKNIYNNGGLIFVQNAPWNMVLEA